jgi:hypothetical protein
MPHFRRQWEEDSYYKHLENYLETKEIDEWMTIRLLREDMMLELTKKVPIIC